MTEKSNLADELRAWRGSYTAAEAAALLGVSTRTWNGWEQGRPSPYERLLRIAMAATKIGGDHGAAE